MLTAAIDRELGNVLGVTYRWSDYIERRVKSEANFVDNIEDMIATAIGDLVVRQEKIKPSLQKAAQNSHNEEELVNNVKGVVTIFIKYSVKNQRQRWTQSKKMPRMQQLSQFEGDIEPSYTDSETLLEEYESEIISRLKKCPKNCGRLANRYQLAIQLVPDRIRGHKIDSLMKRHNLKCKSSTQYALDLIQECCKLITCS